MYYRVYHVPRGDAAAAHDGMVVCQYQLKSAFAKRRPVRSTGECFGNLYTRIEGVDRRDDRNEQVENASGVFKSCIFIRGSKTSRLQVFHHPWWERGNVQGPDGTTLLQS